MFTGIIEEVGKLRELRAVEKGARITVSCGKVWKDLAVGDSVCVNGVCLTAVERGQGYFVADVSEESLRRSTLGGLARGAPLNLERALALGSRLGGHIVQGHVDGTGTLKSTRESGEGRVFAFACPRELREFMVEKGSVAVDGISLTISSLAEEEFAVAAIPHTVAATNLGEMKAGERVNLEVDIIAKYVRSYLDRGMSRKEDAGGGSLYQKMVEGGFV